MSSEFSSMTPADWSARFSEVFAVIDSERPAYPVAWERAWPLVFESQQYAIPKSQAEEEVRSALRRRYPPRRFVTSAEFLAEIDDPTPSYLGAGVISKGGLVVVAGDSGTFKTTYNLNAAVHLSQGAEFHGLAVPEKLRLLFIERESNRTHFRGRLRGLCAALGMESEVLFMAADAETPPIGQDLRSLVEEAQAHVVFLDTIGYFHDGEENSATEWKNNVAKPLRAISRALPWEPAFVAVTHFGKPTEHRVGKHAIRGSSAIIADSDTGITFELKDGLLLQRFVKIRNGPPLADRALDFNRETGVITVSSADPARLAEPRMVTVQKILLDRGDEMRAGELTAAVAKETGLGDRSAEDLIRRAVENGLIEKRGRGRYGAPGELVR